MSNSDKKLILNPFVFPTETDGQFLLLLFVVGGSIFSIVRQLLSVYIQISSEILLSFLSMSVTILVFFWAHLRSGKSAQIEQKRADWQKLSAAEASSQERHGFDNFRGYITEIRNRLNDLPNHRFDILWSAKSREVTGKAFGYRNGEYVLLRRGMFEAFIVNLKAFEVVLLHELSHIANRDVSKTTFSIQLGKCFNSVAGIAAVFLNLFVFFHIIRRLSANLSLIPLWDGVLLFGEINIKLLLLVIFVEITRSSVLRFREYYADKRTAVWLGSPEPMIENLLKATESRKNKSIHNWEGIKQMLRYRLAPLHPTNKERIKALKNPFYLFEPRRVTAILSGILVGLSISSNSGWVMEILLQFLTFITTLDATTSGSNNILFVAFIFVFGFSLAFLGAAIVMVIFGLLGVFPISITVGLQMQKAIFADAFLSARKRILPKSKLIEQSILLSIGLLIGLFINPTSNPVNSGTIAVGYLALFLSPLYALGWIAVFLLWLIPLSWLLKKLSISQRASQVPDKKLKIFTAFSMITLIPIFNAMSWTHVIFSSLIGLSDNTSEEEWIAGAAFAIFGWAFSLILYGVIWAWGYYWLKKKKWLLVDGNHQSPPAWLIAPRGIMMPMPRKIKYSGQNTPPPF